MKGTLHLKVIQVETASYSFCKNVYIVAWLRLKA